MQPNQFKTLQELIVPF